MMSNNSQISESPKQEPISVAKTSQPEITIDMKDMPIESIVTQDAKIIPAQDVPYKKMPLFEDSDSDEETQFWPGNPDPKTPPGLFTRMKDTVNSAMEKMFTVKVQVGNPKIEKQGEEAVTLLKSVTNQFSKISKQLRETLKTMMSKTAVVSIIEQVEFIIQLLVTCIALIRSPNLEMRMYIATMFLSANKVLSKLTALDFVQGMLPATLVAHGKTDADPQEATETMFVMFTKLMAHSVGLGDVQPKLDEKRAKKLGMLGSAWKSVESIITTVFRAIKYAFQWCHTWFYGIPYGAENAHYLRQLMDEIVAVSVLIDSNPDEYWLEDNRWKKVMGAYEKCREVDSALIHFEFNKQVMPYTHAERKVEKLYNFLVNHFKNGGPRPEPIWIHIEGPPAQGKSGFMQMLETSIYAACTGEDVNPQKDVYPYKGDSKFNWEHYMMNFFVVIDDIFQNLSNPEFVALQATELILMKSPAAFPLTMAGVESKGTKFFNSRMVLSTGNKPYWDNIALSSPEAIKRRIDFYIIAAHKKDLNNNIVAPDVNDYILKIKPANWYRQGANPNELENITFDDLIARVQKRYIECNKKNTNLRDYARDLGSRFKDLYSKKKEALEAVEIPKEILAQMKEDEIEWVTPDDRPIPTDEPWGEEPYRDDTTKLNVDFDVGLILEDLAYHLPCRVNSDTVLLKDHTDTWQRRSECQIHSRGTCFCHVGMTYNRVCDLVKAEAADDQCFCTKDPIIPGFNNTEIKIFDILHQRFLSFEKCSTGSEKCQICPLMWSSAQLPLKTFPLDYDGYHAVHIYAARAAQAINLSNTSLRVGPLDAIDRPKCNPLHRNLLTDLCFNLSAVRRRSNPRSYLPFYLRHHNLYYCPLCTKEVTGIPEFSKNESWIELYDDVKISIHDRCAEKVWKAYEAQTTPANAWLEQPLIKGVNSSGAIYRWNTAPKSVDGIWTFEDFPNFFSHDNYPKPGPCLSLMNLSVWNHSYAHPTDIWIHEKRCIADFPTWYPRPNNIEIPEPCTCWKRGKTMLAQGLWEPSTWLSGWVKPKEKLINTWDENHTHPNTMFLWKCKGCIRARLAEDKEFQIETYHGKIQNALRILKDAKNAEEVLAEIPNIPDIVFVKDPMCISVKDDKIPKILFALGGAVGLLGLVFAGWKIVKFFTEPVVIPPDTSLTGNTRYESTELKGGKTAVKASGERKYKKTARAQGAVIKPLEDIAPVVGKNICGIQATFTSGASFSQHLTGLKDLIGWTPAHFNLIMEDPTFHSLVLTPPGKKPIEFLPNEFETIIEEDTDSMYIKFKHKGDMGRFTDITKHHISKEADLSDVLTSPVAFIRRAGSNITVLVADNNTFMDEGDYYLKQRTVAAKKRVVSRNLIDITGDAIQPQEGDCGQPYLTTSSQNSGKIVGYHVAGISGEAYAVHLTREEIDNVCKMFNSDNEEKLAANGHVDLPDGIGERRPVPKQDQVPLPHTTALMRTMFEHNPIAEPIRKPAPLRPLPDGTSPITKALQKGVGTHTNLTPEEEQTVRNVYQAIFKIMFDGMMDPKPITVNQALNRPPGTKHITPVYTETSSGYGENKWAANPVTKGKKKHPFVEKRDKTDTNPAGVRYATPLLIEAMQRAASRILKKEYELIVQDCPKDELRPNEKVDAGKVRLFNPLPIEILMLMRMLFYPLVEHAASTHNTSWFALGVNPHSMEWMMLEDYLMEVDPEFAKENVAAGDVSALDGNTDKLFGEEFGKGVEATLNVKDTFGDHEWSEGHIFTQEQRNLLRIELVRLVFTCRWHVIANWMYKKEKGNPSGNFLTTIFNCVTMAVCIVMSVYWFALSVLKMYLTVLQIILLIRLKLFGDDNLVTWNRSLKGFGMGALIHGFWKLGLTYTDFKKGETIWKDKDLMLAEPQVYNIREVQFLKRNFVRINAYTVYAPAEWSLIIDTTNWCKKVHGRKVGTLKASFAALCEAYFHGRERFDWLLNEINTRLEALVLPKFNITYADMISRFWNIKLQHTLILPFNEDIDSYWNLFFPLLAQANQDPVQREIQEVRAEKRKLNAQMKKEQEKRSEVGVASSIFQSLSKVAGFAKNFPIISEVAVFAAPAFAIIHEATKRLGLDDPRNLAATQKQLPTIHTGFALGRGLDGSELLAFDPTNEVSNDTRYYNEPGGSMCDFGRYKMRPGLIQVTAFDNSDTPGTLISKIPVNPILMIESQGSDTFTLNCLSNYALNFRYWRGSLKYMIQIWSSKFKSSRIRIEWHPDPTLVTFVTDSSVGDIVSLTVDVCGDTMIPFTVPYLKDTPWLPVGQPHLLKAANVINWQDISNGCIAIRVVNPPVVSIATSDSTMDVSIWVAGGEDFEVARLQNLPEGYTYTPSTAASFKYKQTRIKRDPNNNSKLEKTETPKPSVRTTLFAQMSSKGCTIQDQFRVVFPPLAPSSFSTQSNILQGERIYNWVEMLHRYTIANSVGHLSALSNQQTFNPWFPMEHNFSDTNLWTRFYYSFLHHRGNYRYKCHSTDVSSPTVYTSTRIFNTVTDGLGSTEALIPIDPATTGMTMNDADKRRITEVEVPFYGINPIATMQYESEKYELPCLNVVINNSTAVGNSYYEYIATADNFSVGNVCPPGFILHASEKKTLYAQMMQEGHGNEERKPIETTIQETTALSSFRDQVGVKEDNEPAPITKIHMDTDPYGEPTIDMLKRKYIVQQLTWDNTQTYGTEVASLNFPLLLLNVDKIAEITNRFKYIRSEIEVEVRLNSTTYHQGSLLICYSPHWNPTNAHGQATTLDMYHLSTFESITLSACANETVRIHIPYVAPSSYFNLRTDPSDTTVSGFFGTVKIYVLAPLRLIGSALTSLNVTIYASFLNPEVAGYIPLGRLAIKALQNGQKF